MSDVQIQIQNVHREDRWLDDNGDTELDRLKKEEKGGKRRIPGSRAIVGAMNR